LAVPLENPPEPMETRVERCVPIRRKFAMLWRKCAFAPLSSARLAAAGGMTMAYVVGQIEKNSPPTA
jgi:hypothetical protein